MSEPSRETSQKRPFSADFGQKKGQKSTLKSAPLEGAAPGAWRSGGAGSVAGSHVFRQEFAVL